MANVQSSPVDKRMLGNDGTDRVSATDLRDDDSDKPPTFG